MPPYHGYRNFMQLAKKVIRGLKAKTIVSHIVPIVQIPYRIESEVKFYHRYLYYVVIIVNFKMLRSYFCGFTKYDVLYNPSL